MSKITLNGVDYAGGSSGGSGGHTIINPSGQNMPSRTGLQFIGASVADDSVNNKTVVTITGGGGHNYSTSEQVIGTWTNGKPLYERTFEFNNQVIPDLSWTNNILGGNLPTIQIKNYDGYFGLEGLDWEADFDYFRSVSEYFTANSTVHDLNVRPNMNAGVNVTLKRVTIQYTKSTD